MYKYVAVQENPQIDTFFYIIFHYVAQIQLYTDYKYFFRALILYQNRTKMTDILWGQTSILRSGTKIPAGVFI